MNLNINNSILKDVRLALGLSEDTSDFDTELLMHINSAIGKLNQNGVGNFIIVKSTEETWSDLENPLQVEGNQYFASVQQFITLSAKLLFDPPPPSSVEYHTRNVDETLWRLKVAYEDHYVEPRMEP